MQKVITLKATIYQLISEYPELKDILFALGFKEIVKPMMLNSVGKIMTLDKGALMRNIDLNLIKETLNKEGFTIEE